MKRHLNNLTIHQFRGLRQLELRELGGVNLLVGVNNAGKTSVLEAISTYCRPLDPLEWLNTARRREVQSSREAIDAMLTAQLDDPSEVVAFRLPSEGEAETKRFAGDLLDNLRFERGLDIR